MGQNTVKQGWNGKDAWGAAAVRLIPTNRFSTEPIDIMKFTPSLKILAAVIGGAALFTLTTPAAQPGFWDIFKKKPKPCDT